MAGDNDDKPFPFFDLPPEPRRAILALLLVSPTGIDVRNVADIRANLPRSWQPPPHPQLTQLLPLFLVNKQLYREASAVFYGGNQFVLDVSGELWLFHTYFLPGQFLSPQGRDDVRRRRVRNLVLVLHSRVGDAAGQAAPAISDMAQHGSLCALQVRLVCHPQVWLYPASAWFSTTFDRGTDAQTMMSQRLWRRMRAQAAVPKTRPPLSIRLCTPFFIEDHMLSGSYQALFRLLADLRIESVELWVSRLHYAYWCRYHDPQLLNGEEVSVDLNITSMARAPPTDAGTVPEWVRLDWRAMVDEFGSDQKIGRVGESS